MLLMVETLPKQFKKNASRQLADEDLRKALTKSKGHFTGGRQKAIDNLPEFDSLRDKGETDFEFEDEYFFTLPAISQMSLD